MANKPRQQFIILMNYFQNQLDWEKLVEDDMVHVYYEGMKFFEKICGNSDISPLYEEDTEILLALRKNTLSTEELSERFSINVQTVHARLKKVVMRGMVSSTKLRKITYYSLTPHGEKYLRDEILEKLGGKK